MTSTDQDINQSTTDQSDEVSGDEATKQSQTLDTDNQEETISKAEYKRLQAEYTKSRQELSEFKKTSELSEDDKKALDFIKEHGFVTKSDLDNMSKRQLQEASLKDIIAANPDLQPFEAAIKKIWKDWDMAYEDIIQKYGFKSKDKLAKARSQWDIKWMPEKKDKSISEMSTEEYEKYKTKQWWGNNRWTFG